MDTNQYTSITVVTHIEDRILELNQNGELVGLSVEMLKNLEFNSEYKFTIIPRTYEDLLKLDDRGDWFLNDVEQPLLSGEAQMAGSNYYFVHSRSQHLHLLLPTVKDRLSAYFIQPHPMESNSLLTGPFTFETLLLQLLMTALLTASGYVILRVSRGHSSGLGDAMWSVISTFNLQGCSLITTAYSHRALFLSTCLFFIVMHAMYSAFLLSILTSTMNPIRSLPQLLSRKYSIGSTSSLLDYVKGKRISKGKKIGIGPESVRKVFDGGHIHIGHAHRYFFDHYYSMLELPFEDIRKLNSLPYPSRIYSGFYIAKNWTHKLREPLNRRIARLGDIGILHRYTVKYHWNIESSMVVTRRKGFFELELSHVGKLFLILAVSSGIALPILIFEILLHKIFRKIYVRNN